MTRRFLTAVSAVALSATLISGGPALSQQLRDQVAAQLQRHMIEVDNIDALSDTQLSQIELILNTSESDCCKQDMIETVLVEREPCEGNAQLRQQVTDQLAQNGITIENLDSVSGSGLAMIQAVLTSSESREAKGSQIQRILAEPAPIIGTDHLRAEVGQCTQTVNADVDLDALTPAQLAEIQLVAGGSDSATDKKAMIEQIANQ